MTAARVIEWVQRLNAVTLDLSDLKMIEEVRLPDVLDEISASFPVAFLNRGQRGKREIGLAQARRRHVTPARRHSSRTPLRKRTATTDTFQHCLFLTSESDHLTTLAAMNLLRVRTPHGDDEPVELSSGAGFSLYRDPDGWKIKLLEERTISLSRKALHEHGWQWDKEQRHGR